MRLSYGLKCYLNIFELWVYEMQKCLFYGTVIPGQPPVYVGIYVDDIIYFSPSDAVEQKFEEGLSTIGSVDYMGQVSLFLGTEFSWV